MGEFYYCYGRWLMTLNNDKGFYNNQTMVVLEGRKEAEWVEEVARSLVQSEVLH